MAAEVIDDRRRRAPNKALLIGNKMHAVVTPLA